ncbi:MAG: acyltransferase [Verrucomicrobia bacterium]|nr:acyltransferase [Verrucomicrobiota bacterium]
MQNQPLAVGSRTSAGIDALRGVFALLVLLSHAWGSALLGAEARPSDSWVHCLDQTIGHGGFWVNGFFVLSGFCIHLSIINARAQQRYTAWGYALARCTRIYPTFLLSFAFALIAAWISQWFDVPDQQSITPTQMVATLCLMQVFTGTLTCFGQSWSISYEAIYYLAWPLLLLLVKYSGRLAAGLGVAIASSVGLFGLVTWRLLDHGSTGSPLIIIWTIAIASLLWLGGAFLAESWLKLKWLRANAGVSLAVGCIGITVIYLLQAWLIGQGARSALLFGTSLLSGPFFCLLIVGCEAFPVRPWSVSFIKKFGGDLSYPLYLLHGPAILLWICILQATGSHPPFLLLFLENISFGLLFALVVGLPFESALLSWRRKWLSEVSVSPLRASEQPGS